MQGKPRGESCHKVTHYVPHVEKNNFWVNLSLLLANVHQFQFTHNTFLEEKRKMNNQIDFEEKEKQKNEMKLLGVLLWELSKTSKFKRDK